VRIAVSRGSAYDLYLSRGITIAYFVVTLTCFWVPDLSDFDRLIGRLGLVGVLTAFLAIGGAFALFWFIADRVTPHLTAPAFLLSVRDSLIGQNLSLASKMMAIVAITTLLHKAPDFLYKAF